MKEKRKILAVRTYGEYLPNYEVHLARDFDDAKRMIIEAEKEEDPYDQLSLPAKDKDQFWAFVDWMAARGTRYPLAINDISNVLIFTMIRDRVRAMGFQFLD